MNKNQFIEKLKEYFPWVNQQQIEQFEIYKHLLQIENKKINLTRLDSDDKIYDQYFLSSLLPFVNLEILNQDSNWKILDIGSGSGIPGIPLKILFPQIKLVCLDSNNKKTTWLKKLANKLQLNNVEIINDRAENYVLNCRETFDLVTSRAVAELRIILEVSAPFVKLNGYILQPKSLKALVELQNANNIINKLGLNLVSQKQIKFNEHNFTNFLFQKRRKTPKQFPRLWKEILKVII